MFNKGQITIFPSGTYYIIYWRDRKSTQLSRHRGDAIAKYRRFLPDSMVVTAAQRIAEEIDADYAGWE